MIKHYLKGLHGLRFIAASMVMITHIELIKSAFKIENSWSNHIVQSLGPLGVYFFFSLSGFLITYLLFIEKEKNQQIHLKDFYTRRILRIWPLYFLVIFLGFFIWPQIHGIEIHYLQESFEQNFFKQLLCNSIVLPNLGYALYGAVPHIGQTWSIGVEEQFYIFWPLVLMLSKPKNYLKVFVVFVLVIVLLKALFLFWANQSGWLKTLLAMSKFENMAIGGISAYLVFYKRSNIKFLFSKFMQYLAIMLCICALFWFPKALENIQHIFYAFAFSIIIINTALNDNTIFRLEHPYLKWLGELSYGMYMYHLMLIPLLILMLNKIEGLSLMSFNVLLYLSSFLLTILISRCSYVYFEKPFLKIKSRFIRI